MIKNLTVLPGATGARYWLQQASCVTFSVSTTRTFPGLTFPEPPDEHSLDADAGTPREAVDPGVDDEPKFWMTVELTMRLLTTGPEAPEAPPLNAPTCASAPTMVPPAAIRPAATAAKSRIFFEKMPLSCPAASSIRPVARRSRRGLLSCCPPGHGEPPLRPFPV